MILADAYNTLARIELDASRKSKAIEAAKNAYLKAWCDGPPYSYYWGLNQAKRILKGCHVAEPNLPAFDQNDHEEMEKVEIEPFDEFDSVNE